MTLKPTNGILRAIRKPNMFNAIVFFLFPLEIINKGKQYQNLFILK